MKSIHALEVALLERLDKRAPVTLPPVARRGLARSLWFWALVLGVFQLWTLFDRFALRVIDESYLPTDQDLGFMYHLSLVVLAVAAVLALVAAPNLKARRKEGWNLLYYAILAHVMYVLAWLLAGGGFGTFLLSLSGSVLAAYFIFQVHGFFRLIK